QDEYRLNVRQPGYLWLTTREDIAARQRGIVSRLHEWGQTDVEVLDGDDVRRRFGFVGPNVILARFRQGDGVVDPKALTYGLAAGLRRSVGALLGSGGAARASGGIGSGRSGVRLSGVGPDQSGVGGSNGAVLARRVGARSTPVGAPGRTVHGDPRSPSADRTD